MADTVTAIFTRKVGNTPPGTVRELGHGHPALRSGAAREATEAEAGRKAEPVVEDEGPADVSKMKVDELRAEAKRRGVDATGTKKELQERLSVKHPEDTPSADMTDQDGADDIDTEDDFAGESNDGETGTRIAGAEAFEGDVDPEQIVAPGDEDDEF